MGLFDMFKKKAEVVAEPQPYEDEVEMPILQPLEIKTTRDLAYRKQIEDMKRKHGVASSADGVLL